MLKKNFFLEEIILQNCMFSSRFMLFPTFKKKKSEKKYSGGGGGGGVEIFFFFRRIILSHFTFYAIVNIKKNTIEKCPFT